MSMNPQDGSSRPTVVLVHGAFAESASWNDVILILRAGQRRRVAQPTNERKELSSCSKPFGFPPA